MAEILCINLVNMGDLATTQEAVEGDEDLAIKTLIDIVPDAAELDTAEDVVEGADAVGEEGVEGYEAPIDDVVTTIATFTRDLDSSSEEIPTASNAGDLTPETYGDFTNYAARQLYEDISTAFTQRTLVGMAGNTDGQPEAALNHYLTVAIISFVNRLATIGEEGTTTLDEEGV